MPRTQRRFGAGCGAGADQQGGAERDERTQAGRNPVRPGEEECMKTTTGPDCAAQRRQLLHALAALAAFALGSAPGRPLQAQAATLPPSLLVLDFDLIDDHPEPARAADMARRLARMHTEFAEGVAAAGLYRVVDLEPVRALQARFLAQQQFIHRCASCQIELGRAAGAQWVASGWVYKVSNLILYLNVLIREVASGEERIMKSVSIRGNDDRAWARGLRFLVRALAEEAAQEQGGASG